VDLFHFAKMSRPFDMLSRERVAAERAKQAPPRFEGTGLRVGVVADGYGSEGILAALEKAEGTDAVAVRRVAAEFLKPCQVVVFLQRRMQATLSAVCSSTPSAGSARNEDLPQRHRGHREEKAKERRRRTTDFTDSTDEEKKRTRVEARRHQAWTACVLS
jgi:hypothetical protein